MELLESADERALLWLNGWVGHFAWLDAVVELVVSDYLVPVLLALALLGLWFSGANPAARERNQRGVMVGMVGLALANLTVQITNHYIFRPRPFASFDVSLLFYRPTDSSFPANPAAVGFAIATGVWIWNRKAGTLLGAIAALFGLSRVYAGVFYPLDVGAGAAIGVGVSLAVSVALRLVEPLPTLVLRLARTLYLA